MVRLREPEEEATASHNNPNANLSCGLTKPDWKTPENTLPFSSRLPAIPVMWL